MGMINIQDGLQSFGMPLVGASPYLTLRAAQRAHQEIYFVDPVDGMDGPLTAGRTGKSPDKAYKTIQYAHDAMSSERGGYIFVGEGRTKENVVVTKRGIHIIGMGMYRTQLQKSDAVVPPVVDLVAPVLAITISGGNALGVEIAHMRIGGNGGYTGIYVGDGAVSANSSATYIHDCLIDGSNYEGPYGIVIRGGSFIRVEANIIASILTAGLVISSGAIRTAYGNLVRGNQFINLKGVGVAIQDTSNSNLISANDFVDSSAAAMTACITVAPTGVFGACTGIANAAVRNAFASLASPAIAMGANDHAVGNFKRSAGNAATYVAEA
jgi:hypothetical protein